MKIVREKLNEDVSSVYKKAKSFLQSTFKKIGNLFIAFINGKPVPAISPVSIGNMVQNKKLNSAISFIPNNYDIENDPFLKNLQNAENILAKRGTTNESFDKFAGKFNRKLLEMKIDLKHPDPNVVNVDAKAVMRRIRMSLSDRKAKPLMIWGAPGIGKTQIVKQVLEANKNGRLIDVQTSKMAPDDWFLPGIDKETMKAYDIPKSWLPVYQHSDDPEVNAKRNDIANGESGGILFLDELSRASSSVQNTCLKLIDERKVGDYVLGDKWVIISASNRADDDPDSVQNFSTALGNRFSQINYVPDFHSWKNWASKAMVDPRVIDFLEFNQDYFYTLETDTNKTIFASPRSWEAASKNLKLALKDAEENREQLSNEEMRQIVAADVGAGPAYQFMNFLILLSKYTTEDIKEVFTNPEKAKMPTKKGSGYDLDESNALVLVICTSTRNRDLKPIEFENFVKFLIKLDNGSLATKALKLMTDIHPDIHMETGETEGKDKYKKGLDMFVAKYKDIL